MYKRQGLASKGLGSLRSPASLLRKLSYYRLLLTRLRLAKDYKGSNPLLSYQKNIGPDDYVDTSMYARLVETAQRHGAEVAACGYTSFSEEDGIRDFAE